MTPARRLPFAVVCLVWAGIVIGISFIEAPVKFHTPTLTRVVAFDVGRTVFRASQWVQVALGVLTLAAAAWARVPRRAWLALAVVALTLLVQMAWIFPVLDARAEVVIAGGVPSGSSPHTLYGVLEILKLVALGATAVVALRTPAD
jgi:MFS superfamily sulfate permease-like transporter